MSSKHAHPSHLTIDSATSIPSAASYDEAALAMEPLAGAGVSARDAGLFDEPIQVILVGVRRQKDSSLAFETSMDELAALAGTLGWDVVGRLHQRRESLCHATAVGRGKLEQLKAQLQTLQDPEAADATHGSDECHGGELDEGQAHKPERRASRKTTPAPRLLVLFNEPLTPMQFRNIEAKVGVEVLDRTGVILELFRQRASTREARLQVELARLHYAALRMRERRGKQMDQQAAGIGAKGLGEAAHKLEQRWVRDRAAQLRRELEAIAKQRETRRARRAHASGVALVGYTNAGKSSWMRALTGEQVWVKDDLFATIETTTRHLDTATPQEIILSDTVGFIEDLPHELVASFRSTLEEAREASLLLHVVDASAPMVERQIEMTEQTLRALNAEEIPRIMLFNKADRLDPETQETLAMLYPEAHFVSAHRPEDVEGIRDEIAGFFAGEVVEESLVIPYDMHHLMADVYDTMDVLSVSHEEDGSHLLVRAFSAAFDYVEAQLLQASLFPQRQYA